MPLVITDISSGKLSIGFKKGDDIRLQQGLNFHLKVKDLNSVSNSGLGGIEISDFNAESMEIRLSGLDGEPAML